MFQNVSYMYKRSDISCRALSNSLNELGKSDKMRDLLFRNEFNKLNNTGAWKFDSIYHMALK